MNGTIDCPRCDGSGKVLTPEELRRMRTKAGLTQRQLAEKGGLTDSYLSDVENGSRDVTRKIEELYRKHT